MNIKAIMTTAFWRQNAWHKHGVVVHTLRVVYETVKAGNYKMIPAAFLHDIGKPFTAYQKPEDIINKEYSFTDHEEASYLMIADIPFISDYTKNLVRYHYLLRDMEKCYVKGDYERFTVKAQIYNTLTVKFKKDLELFQKYDDLGKGTIA